MKPVIGITTDVDTTGKQELAYAYVQAVIRSGGVPLILPVGIEKDVEQVLQLVDALLLSGGGDINPLLFGEEPHKDLGQVSPSRDAFELELVKRALEMDKPILGICRGLQVLCVAAGGNLYQDIHEQYEGTVLQHNQKAPREHPSHYVEVESDSLLKKMTGKDRLAVNSYHHQSVKLVPPGFKLSGKATDGIIESVEGIGKTFVIGVQWHPELLALAGDEASLKLFNEFIEKSIF